MGYNLYELNHTYANDYGKHKRLLKRSLSAIPYKDEKSGILGLVFCFAIYYIEPNQTIGDKRLCAL